MLSRATAGVSGILGLVDEGHGILGWRLGRGQSGLGVVHVSVRRIRGMFASRQGEGSLMLIA